MDAHDPDAPLAQVNAAAMDAAAAKAKELGGELRHLLIVTTSHHFTPNANVSLATEDLDADMDDVLKQAIVAYFESEGRPVQIIDVGTDG